jgi:uncharacterized caspase-like protein
MLHAERQAARCVGVVCAVVIALTTIAQEPAKTLSIAPATDLPITHASTPGVGWALLVGVGAYPDVEGYTVSRLSAPVKDVEALRRFLTDPELGAFPPENVRTLIDEQASKEEILLALANIHRRAAPEDLVLFYFSGHGYRPHDGEEGTAPAYLLPYITNRLALSNPAIGCIKYEDITDIIRLMEAEKVVVFLDACHAGGVKPRGSRFVSGGVYGRFWDEWEEARGHALLLSSDESQLSWEEPDGSVFTKFLLKGLEGEADLDDNAIVGFAELAEYLERVIPPYTREKFGRKQTPTRRYDLGPVNGDIPLAVDRAKWKSIRGQEVLDQRNASLLLATQLSQEVRDFALAIAKSAHHRADSAQAITSRETALLGELDAYSAGDISQEDFILRARAVFNSRGIPEESDGGPVVRLQLDIAPADATVSLTPVGAPRKPAASAPGKHRVAPGEYRLSVTRNGFAPYDRRIAIDRSSTTRVSLERLRGSLRVHVTPRDAAIDAEPVSMLAQEAGADTRRIVPNTDPQSLPIGMYRITATRDGYAAKELPTVAIRSDEITTINISLVGKATIRYPTGPPGVVVTIDGVPQTLPSTVTEGLHKVTLERAGYERVELEATVTVGQQLDLFPDWARATGNLTVTSTPLGADVYLDSAKWGQTPLTLDEVPTGEHELELALADHEPVRRAITIAENPKPIEITMARSRGNVHISSEPDGATVRVDGTKRGTTPTTIRMSAGQTTISLSKAGSRDVTREVHIQRGDNPPLVVDLDPTQGTITLTSTPPGASVKVGSAALPDTAPTEATLPPGEHTLTFSLSDYEPFTQTVSIADRDAKEMHATLRHETQLLVTSDPPGASLTIPQLGSHRTPVTLRNVTPGEYIVNAAARGYSSSSTSITIAANRRNTLDLPLNAASGASRAIRSAIVPGLGQYRAGRPATGALFLLAAVGAGAASGFTQWQYSRAVSDHDDAQARYNVATRADQIQTARREVLDTFDDVDATRALRSVAIAAAVGIWAANVSHAYLVGPASPSDAGDPDRDLAGWNGGIAPAAGSAWITVNHRF